MANLDNSRKVFEGGIVALKRSGFAATRKAEEEKLAAWIKADAKRVEKYGDVLRDLERVSNDFYAVGARDRLLRTFPSAAYAPVYKQVLDAVAAMRANQKLTDKKRAEIDATMKDREPLLEREMLKYFLRASSELPANERFEAADAMFGDAKTAVRRKKEEEFAKSIVDSDAFDTAEKIASLYDMSFSDFEKKHSDIARLAAAHADERAAYSVRAGKFVAEIEGLRLSYQRALAEMRGNSPYPDANSTLRFTYGNVKGYEPREAVKYTPFTTLKGVIEKDTGVFPFDVPQKLKNLQQDKDFGRYGVGDSVPVNFLSTNDIIGGNSGSPILNAYGEQVGIIFDGNFEGLGDDLFYDPNYGRTISVDIRYVLFVTEKFGGAKWIVDELTIKGGTKVKKAKA